jgi:uncharacterized membrane protein YedE/YeeE
VKEALLPLAAAHGWSALALAAAIGVAFGVALERAGLGSARKLAGQFFLADFTVFKVMFSAIVTALAGITLLSALGLVDPSRLPVPQTFVGPQVVGGLVFGLGFVLGGLCPGTSCVAAATGRGDGIALIGGLLAGILVVGIRFDALETFYRSGARGRWRLPEALGVPEAAVVAGVIALAGAGFWAAERLERKSKASGHR